MGLCRGSPIPASGRKWTLPSGKGCGVSRVSAPGYNEDLKSNSCTSLGKRAIRTLVRIAPAPGELQFRRDIVHTGYTVSAESVQTILILGERESYS